MTIMWMALGMYIVMLADESPTVGFAYRLVGMLTIVVASYFLGRFKGLDFDDLIKAIKEDGKKHGKKR